MLDSRGRAPLGGISRPERATRRANLRAALDEAGPRLPGWPSFTGGYEIDRDRRLDVMWSRSGPGKRARWTAALARDLAGRGAYGGADPVTGRLVIGGSAAEIVARETIDRPADVPATLRTPAHAIAEAEKLLGETIPAAPRVADSIARYLAQQHTGRRAIEG